MSHPVTRAPALAPSQQRPTALVTLGDSSISGEAGRWNGNSSVPLGSRAGTERAWRSAGLGGYDLSLLYGSTAKGCDRSDAFAGREVCARTAAQSTGTPDPETAEWARFLDTDVQGCTQESLHPSAYGQGAMGRCYTLLAAAEGSATCLTPPGPGPDGIYLVPIDLAAGGR